MKSVRLALSKAGIGWKDLEGIAVTKGPGLVGALLVGISLAKSLAYGWNIPFVGVNHLEGHLFSLLLEDPEWKPPYLVLIASGGHTEIHLVNELGSYSLLGATVDDAAGEAFDKVGVMLGLDYPAGANLDELADEADGNGDPFPIASVNKPGHNFSFSGLKTAVMLRWQGLGDLEREQMKKEIAASFRTAAVEALLKGVEGALNDTDAPRIAVAGGVANNRLLRRSFIELAGRRGIDVAFPSPRLCTDNAAMIAAAGAFHLARGLRDPLDLDADPSLRLPSELIYQKEEEPPGGLA
jgi:N6-L-threonylcarbamoyladenine synthase